MATGEPQGSPDSRPYLERSSRSPWVPLLGVLLTVACQSPDTATSVGGLPKGFQDGGTVDQPSLDRSVEEHLTQLIRSSRIIEGHRVVELELRNQAADAVSFAYNIEWLDRAGNPVSDMQAVWTPLVLGAGEAAPIEFRAPSPRADSWRLIAASLER